MTDLVSDETQTNSRDKLWNVAVSKLHAQLPTDLKELGATNADTTTELQSICQVAVDRQAEAQKKQWKFRTKTGKTVVLRDLWGNVLGWAKRFQAVGDVAIQADAGYASLPWALVRLLLTAAIGEHETYAQMLEGMDFVSGLIVQYAVVEQLYASGVSQLIEQLRKSLMELYISILQYLIHSTKYFGYNRFRRALAGINQSMNGELNQIQQKVNDAKIRVDADASLVHHDLIQSGIDVLAREQGYLAAQGDKILAGQQVAQEKQDRMLVAEEHQKERTRIVQEVLENWQRPLQLLVDQVLDIHTEADDARNTRIADWLSTIRIGARHVMIREGRLSSSGKWLFRHPKYQEWAESPHSSVIWMHGLLGTGKTNLTSAVIDDMEAETRGKNDSARLAYFYCTRNKAGSGNEKDLSSGSEPVEIFRSLLKQLARNEKTKKLDIIVQDKYHQLKVDVDGPRRLTMSECVELILAILSSSPVTIIIDALDECISTKVRDLIQGLDEIVIRSPRNVKVFLSTRPVSVVVDCLRDKQYTSLEVNAEHNSDDISNFIGYELDRRIREKQLLHGNVSDELRRDLLSNLSERAGSMFWYASLQLSLLCDPTAEQDESSIRAKLTELPANLKEAYTGIIDEITSSKNSERSRVIAQNTMKWLLCAQEPLPSSTFLEAISSTPNDHLDPERVSSMCRSLVYLDKENDKFEFAHLSVREHLEQEIQYSPSECHLVAAESCLRALESSSRSNAVNRAVSDSVQAFSHYATLYWPIHLQKIDFGHMDECRERLKTKLKTLLVRVRDVSPIFEQWISRVEKIATEASLNPELLLRLESLRAVPTTPLFAASIFGFSDLVKQFRLISGYNLEQQNIHKQTPLSLAVENDQLETVKAFLEDIPRAKVPPVDVNQVNVSAVEQFLELNPTSPPRVMCFATALQAAACKGNVVIAKYLIEKGARIDLVAGYYGSALQAAALNGHAQLVSLLLDYGAEPNGQGGYHGNALQAAAFSGDLPTVSALIDSGAMVSMPGGHYGTAFMAAVESRSRDVVELLIYNQAQINRASKIYGTPLQRAADLDSFDIVALLVNEKAEMGVRRTAETHDGQLAHTSALAAAAWGGHTRIVSVLLRNGAEADTTHREKERHLLHQAALCGMVDLVEYCIETCACDVNMLTDQRPNYVLSGNMTPLSFACSEGQVHVVRLLLSKGALLDFGSEDYTTLWLAARRGHSVVLRLLLEASADRRAAEDHLEYVNSCTPKIEQTALFQAVAAGSFECVNLLLSHGARLNLGEGLTPMRLAIAQDGSRVVELLVQHLSKGSWNSQENLDAQDLLGSTPLFYAIELDRLDIVVLLLNSGADPTICRLGGNSVLHIAGEFNRVQILRELFRSHGFPEDGLNLRNDAGETPLVRTLRMQAYDAARMFLEAGAEWIAPGKEGSLLHVIMENSQDSICEYIAAFDGYPDQLNAFLESIDAQGRTSLLVAAANNYHRALEILLNSGAQIDAVDARSQTALMLAVIGGHGHCTQTLLKFASQNGDKGDCLINHRNIDSNTTLHEAIIHRRRDAVTLLLGCGANMILHGKGNQTVLHAAIDANTEAEGEEGYAYPLIKELLEKAHLKGILPYFIDSCTGLGATALFRACERKMHKVSLLLLEYGADCFLSSSKNISPLHIAAYHGSVAFAEAMLEKLLLDYDADRVRSFINQRNVYGMTALNDTCRMGRVSMVQLLVGKYKADYTLAGKKGDVFSEYTPLHSAVWSNHTGLIHTLLQYISQDSDVQRRVSVLNAHHTKDGLRRTALIDAAETSKAATVQMLLGAGADCSVLDDKQCTPLHKSVSKGDAAVTRTLLDHASRSDFGFVNYRNQHGKTAMMDAAERDLASMIKMLLEYPQTDYAVQDIKGFTALHWGAYRDKRAAIEMLLKMASQDKTDEGARFRDFINHRAHQNGVSALFDAAVAGHVEMSRLLLDFGVNYYTFDDAGHHPLHYAVRKDYFDLLDLYLEYGFMDVSRERIKAFVEAKDPDSGLTMWGLADKKGSTRIKKILSKRGIGRDPFL
ncbi:MAG: hypothetical protein Q9219_006896 [cf. Caloplaca sp. 3 TL-2023]